LTAIDDLISDLQGAQYSAGDQNIIAKVLTFVLALQAIQSGASFGVQTANTFLAGPTGGAPANPTFRALNNADFAALTSLLIAAAGVSGWTGRAVMASPADGIITLLNAAQTDFTRLNLGGATSAFPALQRTAAALQAELADGSGLANFICAQLQPSQALGILGTTTNNSVAAGGVGEFVETIVTNAAPVSVSTGTAKDLATLALTAGDWDVEGLASFNPTVSTAQVQAGISQTLNTLPALELQNILAVTIPGRSGLAIPRQRLSLAAGATVRLVVAATFGGGTCSAYGFVNARRVR
jgi:hypothetical protein